MTHSKFRLRSRSKSKSRSMMKKHMCPPNMGMPSLPVTSCSGPGYPPPVCVPPRHRSHRHHDCTPSPIFVVPPADLRPVPVPVPLKVPIAIPDPFDMPVQCFCDGVADKNKPQGDNDPPLDIEIRPPCVLPPGYVPGSPGQIKSSPNPEAHGDVKEAFVDTSASSTTSVSSSSVNHKILYVAMFVIATVMCLMLLCAMF
jgi:hypothetical protein